jgi:hypothetical protein
MKIIQWEPSCSVRAEREEDMTNHPVGTEFFRAGGETDMTNHPVGAELFRADGETDRHD